MPTLVVLTSIEASPIWESRVSRLPPEALDSSEASPIARSTVRLAM